MRKIAKSLEFVGSKGFTLIEMLIVIAVIAILAGVVLTGVSGFQASARDTSRIGDLRNVQNHLELYFNKCGHYPVDDGTTCGSAPATAGTLGWGELTKALEKVSSQIPSDPAGSTPYEYGYGTDGLSYELQATLERDNNALQNDADGDQLSCDDTVRQYCVKS